MVGHSICWHCGLVVLLVLQVLFCFVGLVCVEGAVNGVVGAHLVVDFVALLGLWLGFCCDFGLRGFV